MEENALISVIVPIYDVEAYLEQCLDSILNQTYKNLEVILVDDGSPDRCGAICDSYAVKDPRVVVIHKENSGVSDARNAGIDIAKGRYLTFVDSDDYLALDCIECLYCNLNAFCADISITSHFTTKNYDWTQFFQTPTIEIYDSESAVVETLYARKIKTSAWGKLYRKELFKEIRYPKGKIFEDLYTTNKLFMDAKKIVWTDRIGYYYRIRSGSIMRSAFSMKNLHMLDALDEMERTLPMENQQIAKAHASQTMECMVTILAHKPGKAIVKEYGIWKRVRKYRLGVIMDQNAPKRARMWSAVSYLGSVMLANIMNTYYKST